MDVISRLDVQAASKAAKEIDRTFVEAGKSTGQKAGKAIGEAVEKEAAAAGKSAGQSMSDEIDKATRRVGAGMLGQFGTHGVAAGRQFGGAFGTSLASSIPVVSGFKSAMAGYESAAGKAGAVAGRALGLAFTTAAAGIIGAAGYTLFKGFERYQSIDEARVRLENLNKTLEATGRAQLDVGKVMSTVEGVVTGTRFSLDQAFSIASRALGAATGPLDRFMKVVADGAAFAGADIEEIGSAFIKVARQGKLSAGEIQNELRDLNVTEWLAATMGKSTAEISKLVTENKVGLKELMVAVEFGAKDMAKGSANSIKGALEQVQTAVSRTGANFLGAIFGQPTEQANTLVDSVNALADRLNGVNKWVVANQDKIRHYFESAANVAKAVAEALADIGRFLLDHPGLIKAVAIAFGAWKAISGVTALTTSLGLVSTSLDAMPGKAQKAATGINKAFAMIVVPAIGEMLNNELNRFLEENFPAGHRLNHTNTPDQLGRNARQWVNENIFGQRPPSESNFYKDWYNPSHERTLVPPGVGPLPEAPRPPVTDTPSGPVLGPPSPDVPAGAAGVGGSDIMDARGSDDDSAPGGSKGPVIPQVPYSGDPMELLQGFPVDAALYGQAGTVIDARHRLEQSRAKLQAVEAHNDSTAEDIQSAKNDVLKNERELQESEMRLDEAKLSATEKSTKQIKSLTGDLGELGASLDADFGISKGLAGIAENITKFVANLAAAPLLGKLGAVSATAPTQGGHGVMGVLGARGVFGPQYQNNQYADAAAKQAQSGKSSSVQPGVAMAIPGGTPKQYQQGMVPNNVNLLSVLETMFPGLTMSADTGRQDKFGEHGSGEALDIMVGANSALGDQINQFLLSNADALGLQYNIWKQATWRPDGSVNPMEDRGSPTQNHMDHVHARVKPGPAGPGGSVVSAPAQVSAPASASATLAASPGGPVSVYVVNMPAAGFAMTVPGGGAAPGGTVHGAALTSPGPGNFGTGTGQVGPGMAGPPQAGAMPFGVPQPATRIGGGAGLTGSGQGGVGVGGGVMDAAMMAAGGLDMLMPGMGQVAQTGTKLINRGIEYAGQVVGIGAQGLMDTFIPFGGSELASNNWLTKIVGGLAGAAPAMPNLAGKSPEPPLQGQEGAQQGQGQGQGGNTFGDINVTTNREDGAAQGRDIAYHLQAQHAAPGM